LYPASPFHILTHQILHLLSHGVDLFLMAMNNISDFLLYNVPTGVVAFDPKMEIVYSNKQARYFLNRYELPDEITTLSKRIFDAVKRSSLHELFPGEIHLTKKFEGSSSNWRFSFLIRENPEPLVVIFIMEEKISNKLDLNEIRKQFGLTRKQTDILRRVMDGLKNAEISEELGITEQTVKDHLSNIYEKIGVQDRMSLMRVLMYTS
jgi:DNA-binding CsgD family transcriptional regulator